MNRTGQIDQIFDVKRSIVVRWQRQRQIVGEEKQLNRSASGATNRNGTLT